MRVRVDPEACAGHARCHAVAGDFFQLDELGYAIPLDAEVAPGQAGLARRGAAACPEGAITITDDERPDQDSR
jgi:ferredoxin